MKKFINIFFICLVVFSFVFTAIPALAQDMSGNMGCCQFEGDEPGCWYPSDPDSCSNLDGNFLKDSKNCSMETGYCEGYKKDGESPSESKK